MGIKNKNKDPKITDFSTQDLVVNTKDGALFYKSNTDLFKVQGDNVKTEDIPGQVDSEAGSSNAVFITAFGIHLTTSDAMHSDPYPISWSEDHSQATIATYHYLMAPYNGTLKKINIYFANDPGSTTIKTYTHTTPTAGASLGDLTLKETFTTSPGANTLNTTDCNTSITQNELLLVTVQSTNDISGHVAGNIVIEYDTST